MKKLKCILAALAATFMTAVPLVACSSKDVREEREEQKNIHGENQSEIPSLEENDQPNGGQIELPEEQTPLEGGPQTQPEEQPKPEETVTTVPQEKEKPNTVTYFTVTSDGVNIRAGAGTGYSVRGQAQKSTLYCLLSDSGGWYKTGYRSNSGYVSSKYCTLVNMTSSDNELIEAVIEEGCKLLGTPYVYGATRLHDGRGNLYKSFTTDEFDCSSLMQYIFYKGANKLLDVNTRTQVYQGTTVTASQLKRGDLMFFTNAQRKNNKGVERIGHVALYLGDNYILHTASDYAKIEQISSTRWSYFIQAQRIL